MESENSGALRDLPCRTGHYGIFPVPVRGAAGRYFGIWGAAGYPENPAAALRDEDTMIREAVRSAGRSACYRNDNKVSLRDECVYSFDHNVLSSPRSPHDG